MYYTVSKLYSLNHSKKGGSMKRTLMTVFVILLNVAILSLAACAHVEKPATQTQDLLIKSEVETAVSMLQAIYTKHQEGKMNLEQAKKIASDLLRDLRYGKDGYFWADTTKGVKVVQ